MTIEIQKDGSYLWRIKNFSSRSCETADCVRSPYFTVNSLSDCKWRLSLYPGGNSVDAIQYVSCYLRFTKGKDCAKEYVVDFEISLMNVDRDILATNSSQNRTFKRDIENWGWASFAKIDQVKAELKKCSEDTLIVWCCIKNKDASNKMKSEKYNLKWPVKLLPFDIFETAKHLFYLDNVLFEIRLSVKDDDCYMHVYKLTKSVVPSHSITGKVSLLNTKGNETFSITEKLTFDSKYDSEIWKFKLITNIKWHGFISEHIMDGNIVLECEFTVNCEGPVTSTFSNPNSNLVSNLEGLLNLSSDFQSLLSSKTNSDVKLKVDRKTEQLAHRFVLAARSPVFSAMFDREMLEKRTGTVHIQDVDPKPLKSFIEFLYTGMVDDMNYDKATQLLVVADKYQVSSLKNLCVSYLISALSVKNVCEILVLAYMINHTHLKFMSIDYISAHTAEIFPSMEWLEIVEKYAKLSMEVTAYIVENCTITSKYS